MKTADGINKVSTSRTVYHQGRYYYTDITRTSTPEIGFTARWCFVHKPYVSYRGLCWYGDQLAYMHFFRFTDPDA